LRDALVAILASYLNKAAIEYLNTFHYDKLNFTDETKSEYRSQKEIAEVEHALERATSTLSEELIEELEANGLDLSKNEQELYNTLVSVLQNQAVVQKMQDNVDKLVSELS
jgi:hypothetical protein